MHTILTILTILAILTLAAAIIPSLEAQFTTLAATGKILFILQFLSDWLQQAAFAQQ